MFKVKIVQKKKKLHDFLETDFFSKILFMFIDSLVVSLISAAIKWEYNVWWIAKKKLFKTGTVFRLVKGSRHLFNFRTLRCGTYWKVLFKRGRLLFQDKKKYSYKMPNLFIVFF